MNCEGYARIPISSGHNCERKMHSNGVHDRGLGSRVRRADLSSGKECSPAVHIVEDDSDFRAAVDRLLRAAGYEVRQFGNAREFEASGRTVAPGCLLLEVKLPDGISGLDLQARLLASGVRMPVILMTG